jgi:hypothetical protein
LQIPYIVRVEPDTGPFVLELCANPWTQSSDTIYDRSERSV